MIQARPKGSMCIACRHALRDCSWLNFGDMPHLRRTDDEIVVRCTGFERHSTPTICRTDNKPVDQCQCMRCTPANAAQ